MSPFDRRREYARAGFGEADALADPIEQFRRWLDEASAVDPETDSTAMALATTTPDGRPSARVVLLKGLDERGFMFYTNLQSRKGRELHENPRAALLFHWGVPERQVRIEGRVERVPDADSDAYFDSRPLGARLSATVSPQSEVIPDRGSLERRVETLRAELGDRDPARPEFWGGFRVVPDSIEFWQGRPDRLHDRLRYTRSPAGRWRIERLAP